jgi:hypothetical protein
LGQSSFLPVCPRSVSRHPTYPCWQSLACHAHHHDRHRAHLCDSLTGDNCAVCTHPSTFTMRPRRPSSDFSDDESFASDSSGSSTRRSTVSRKAIKDEHIAIKILKIAAGAPPRPCAVKKVKSEVPYESSKWVWSAGHWHQVTTTRFKEMERMYWEYIDFDDSISEIDARRHQQSSRQSSRHSSRQSSSSRRSKHRKSRQYQEEPDSYEDEYEESYDGSYDEPEFFHHPPAAPNTWPRQQGPPHPHPHPPPPPPPPPNAMGGAGGPTIINVNSAPGVFREGWD